MRIEKNQRKKKMILIGFAVIFFTVLLTTFLIVNAVMKEKNNSEAIEVGTTDAEIETIVDTELLEEIEVAENEIIVLEDEEPEEAEEPKELENKKDDTNTQTSTLPYYIKVNLGAQVVNIYTKDENGEYTVPYKAMICSTGTATPTSGVYTLPKKYKKAVKARWIYLQGNVWGQYGTRITGNILFHSVPYVEQNPGTLEWWEYDKLGSKASLGCVRLTVKDAKWIYENCAAGTKVEFYSSSNPGPLGKPSAKKISNADESVRGWDPTDPSADNPWKNYQETKSSEESGKSNTTSQTVENNTTQNSTNIVEESEKNESSTNQTTTNQTITNQTVTNQVVTNYIANQITSTTNIVSNQENSNSQVKVENKIGNNQI